MQLGDISVNFVELMREACHRLNVDPMPVLNEYGVTTETLASPKARISISRFMRIGQALISTANQPALGLFMGQALRITHMGLSGYAAMTSSNLERAIRLWIHYESLSSVNKRGSSRFYLTEESGVAQFYSISPYNEFNYFVVDCLLSGWSALAHWITGQERLLKEVEIEFEAPPYAQHYQLAFNCPVKFGRSRNALIFRKEALTLPSIYANPATHSEIVSICNRELTTLVGATSLTERVKQIITPMLQGREVGLTETARQLGLSEWTLQRRLKKEGVQFQQVLDETRKQVAATYLKATDLTIGEIAYLLGFSSPAAFHRAFKRWFGVNPKPFKDQHTSGRVDGDTATGENT
ncbi:AraC family transcriptional regulator [Hahella aquimaris]|uniref:AraC family transcriptional regulator n=1 Tax=Hahella sp. HNIBRBA332 TaxID=3015983 RepID=UPI00273A97DB|nr:AraC family transcriptional regulator [Hahella sp. HNIBRBA332]WLQ15217.1 AraC family transcriptional regulator [Hahella sp. HNIBRBA332]